VAGPLAGIRVVELGGIGPGPHAAMMLGDLGADVVRVERPSGGLDVTGGQGGDHLMRSRRSVGLNLKDEADKATLLALVEKADVVVEGFRPGVAEKLGIGPDTCLERNPRVVYARMTGWGQTGPMAHLAGHDINYVGLTGALHAIGPADKPVPPINLLGDFGGGSMLLVQGVLAALVERGTSGQGQVVDAAIVDGTSTLMQFVWALQGIGLWQDRRGANLLDGGAPFYDTYRCSDGGWMAVGSLEPQFYALLLEGLGLADADLPPQMDPSGWPRLREVLTETFASRTREEWTKVFAGTDACVTPVLTMAEAAQDEHLRARGTIVDVNGATQAGPAPRFSRTVPDAPTPPPVPGRDNAAVLSDWGVVGA
jgi:alpha-methylacyl-CoA racemase